MKLDFWWSVIKTAGTEFLVDKAPRLGAALAYYAIFSLAPLLVIVIGIIGAIYGRHEVAESYVIGQIDSLVGQQGGDALRSLLTSAGENDAGIIGSILGIAMLLVGATGLFGQLQDALNTIWEVQPRNDEGIWGIIRNRFLSFAMILGIAFLLLVSLVVSAALAALGSLMGDWQAGIFGQALNFAIGGIVVTLLFAMIFRYLPDAEIAWREVWFGAIVTAILFSVGKLGIGVYLGSSGLASSYGAAGSLAVLLVWLYYSSQIFLFGAELTQAHAALLGSHIVAKNGAKRLTEDQRRQEGIPHAKAGAV
jgi:membrane protein